MYISIDIGGTNTRILMTGDLDNPDFESVVYIPTKQSYEAGLQDMFDVVGDIKPKAIAIGFAGGVDLETQSIDGSNALPDWHSKPLGVDCEDKYNCPVFVHNDAVMGAYGEVYDMEQHHDFMYLTWGTGLGGALVEWQNNKARVYRPEDRALLYKIEEGVGGACCEEYFGKKMSELSDSEWDRVINNIADGARQLSRSVEWGKNTFVLGGGITTRQLDRLQKLTDGTEARIILSKLGDKSGLFGGLAVIKDSL